MIFCSPNVYLLVFAIYFLCCKSSISKLSHLCILCSFIGSHQANNGFVCLFIRTMCEYEIDYSFSLVFDFLDDIGRLSLNCWHLQGKIIFYFWVVSEQERNKQIKFDFQWSKYLTQHSRMCSLSYGNEWV